MSILPPEPPLPALILPGTITTPPLSKVYVEGIPSDLAEPAPGTTTRTDSQRFWSSQPRSPFDVTPDNLIVALSKPRLINYLSLDLARFPHQLSAFWWDGSDWEPLVSAANGAPIIYLITGSVPQVVGNPGALAGGQHPSHYGAGHWVHHDDVLVPVTTDKLCLTAVRGVPADGVYPVDGSGKRASYPVGVRNLDFGYRVRTRNDVPWTPRSPAVITERQPFTTGSDVHGSPVTISVRENRASDLLRGVPWKCAPQVRPDAVVSLYVDARDRNGNGQVIDRFYVNPVTSGVRFNLYFSPAPPPAGGSFPAQDAPLVFPAVSVGGAQLPQPGPSGLLFPAGGGYLDLVNQATGGSSALPWFAAMAFRPQFGSSDAGTHMLVDAGLMQFAYQAGSFTFSVSGSVVGTWSFPFAQNALLCFLAGFDGSRLFAWMPGQPMMLAAISGSLPPVSVFRFGDEQSGPSEPGNYSLAALIIKQQAVDITNGIPQDFMSFSADPSDYVYPPGGSSASTLNAIARFHPSFIMGVPDTGVNPYGFVGGPGSSYESCTWTPVLRDFKLARGYLEFEPARASVFKFEFTHLQAQHYDYFGPAPQAVKRHPAPQNPGNPVLALHPGADAQVDTGLTVNQDTAPLVNFADSPPVLPDVPPGSTLPTEGMYLLNPVDAADAADRLGSMYNLQPWQPPYAVPKNVLQQPHAYEATQVPYASRLAYFVSLSSISMYRSEFTAQDDTERYIDNFNDTHNINPASLTVSSVPPLPWMQAEGMLTTPGSLPPNSFAQVRSNVLSSYTPVRGVQFAAVQSDSVQLLPDPDFADPTLSTWINTGDSPPLVITDLQSQLGNLVLVSRVPGAYGWSVLQAVYQTWNAFTTALPTWNALQQNNSSFAFGGIAFRGKPVPVTQAGRVYAAARVFSPSALTQPLSLQLLDGLSGAVIAEADQPVAGGIVTEWWAGYTIGQPVSPSAYTWTQVTGLYPKWTSFAGASWSQVDTFVPALGRSVSAQVIQKGATNDTWYADDISIFEDSVVWEFSNDGGVSWYPAYDIRNNPNGVMLFPPPASGKGNQLAWRLSGYRPNLHVASLAIRPWYTSHPTGVPPRAAGIGHGPNVTPRDHYGPVAEDPRWMTWDSPIPQSWYFAQKQLLGTVQAAFTPPLPPPAQANVVLAENVLVIPPPSVTPGPVSSYTDVFSDTFEDYYGLADGSDFYTDLYADLYDYSSQVLTGTVRTASAAFTASGVLTASATGMFVRKPTTGAAVGQVNGDANAVTAFITRTRQPLQVRRVSLGNAIPAALAGSLVQQDAGVRKVSLDFRPDATNTPAQLDAFLASCAAGGLEAEITLWAVPDSHYSAPPEYLAMLAAYVPVVRGNGYAHVFAASNYSVLHNDMLAHWYPGDALTDIIAAEFYPTPVFIDHQPKAVSMNDVTLAVIGSFASAHGKPLGISGMGVDRTIFSEAQGKDFLSYVQRFFSARKQGGKANGNVIYNSTGSYDLTGGPQSWVALYDQISTSL